MIYKNNYIDNLILTLYFTIILYYYTLVLHIIINKNMIGGDESKPLHTIYSCK